MDDAQGPPFLIIRMRCRAREIERLTRPMFNKAVTPQAIAGYKRGERDRLARHRKAWGLLAGVVVLPLVDCRLAEQLDLL